jgi:hypothetical protein
MDMWNNHLLRVGAYSEQLEAEPQDTARYRGHIEPWLSAILQSEHVSLLLGNGLTTAVAKAAAAQAVHMGTVSFDCPLEEEVNAEATRAAAASARGEPNIEDQITAALTLAAGLAIQNQLDLANQWRQAIREQLTRFMHSVLATEAGIRSAEDSEAESPPQAVNLLLSFLLTFASRTASRERTHILTTNYDRLIEHGCDLIGLRVLDRFVGALAPVFRSSRLNIDYHYNPPGIRGEPRYLEGVVKLTKLHGSIDWRYAGADIYREPLPFGADNKHPAALPEDADSLMIYPNSAKDIAASSYPYAELLRDFSSAITRPNSVLITYGSGFGDDHVNRVIRDMLTIPSTHLVIISWEDANGRIQRFCEATGSDPQISLLIGSHFADLGTLVRHYLPKPAVDSITYRMADMVRRRAAGAQPPQPDSEPESTQGA